MKKYLVRSLALLMALLLAVPPVGVMAEEPEPVSTEISVEETAGEPPAVAEPAPEEPAAESGTESLPEEPGTEETVTEEPADSVTEVEPEPEVEPETGSQPETGGEVQPEAEPEGETQPEAEEPAVSLMGEADVELLATTASGTCGTNLTWTLSDTGVLTISGTGAMKDYSSASVVPWYSHRASITKVVLKSGVTSIGNYAFSGCNVMESVTIPSGVKTIGTSAFRSCSALKTVAIPKGVTALSDSTFYACTALTSVTIPSGVTSIGGATFSTCRALESITIPSSVTSIGNSAFAYCEALKTVTIPEGVTTLGNQVFISCDGITSVSLPDSLTSIGHSIFYACFSLTDVRLPESMTTIPSNTFSSCSALADITIPESVTIIDTNAFTSCKAMTSITIPKSVVTIRKGAFNYCSALAEVWYDGTATDWSKVTVGTTNDPLNNAVFHFAGTANLASGTCGTNLKWVMHHDGSLVITGSGAMPNYTSPSGGGTAPWYVYRNIIKSVALPSGLTNIGDYAFYYCRQLEEVEIPKGVTSIGVSAFYQCSGMTAIHIPRSMTTIGGSAFSYCSAVTDLWYGGTEEDWAAVSKSSSYLSFKPEIHYTNNLCGEDALWYFDAATGTLTITGTGDMKGYSATSLPWKNYLSQIKKVVIESGITSVGKGAFEDCVNLTSVSLPGSLTKIDMFAFNGCTALERITIPYGVKTLGTMAFWTCDALSSVSLPSTLTTIGEQAFGYCDSLTAITIPASVTTLGNYAFQESGLQSVTVPANVTSMGNRVFFRCYDLTDVTFAEGSPLTAIPEGTFYFCDSLTEITLPQGITTIGSGAFDYCDALEDVYFRGSLDQWNAVSIGSSNYYLTSATIHVAKIAEGTCGDALTWLLTGEGELIISGTGAMYDFTNNTRPGWYDYRESILRVTVESGATTIGESAFSNCSAVTAVTLPGSVKTIGDYAFSAYDSKLGAITIPAGVTTIGESAFSNCSNLTTVTFAGNSVTSIEGRAFSCTNLAAITLPTSLKSLGEYAFEMCPMEEIFLPANTTDLTEVSLALNGLKTISVAAGNPSFSTIDGVLFDKEQTTLVTYPCGRTDAEYAVPEGTITIGPAAFWFSGLKYVTLPNSLETISYGAFHCSDGILYLKIPAGVTEIGDYAFQGIYELQGVEFTGKAPAIGANAFDDLTIPVYYPAGDDTWTEEVRQNYGGTLTWKTEKTIVSSGTCGAGGSNLTWTLDETGLLTISGTGDMKDYAYNSYSSVPWYGKDVYRVVIGEGVTSIGDYTFYGGDMINVTIPASVTEIGSWSFAYCYDLETVNFAGNAPAIANSSFSSVTATACYPQGDATWTASMRQNYGGTLTWKAVKEKVYSGKCGDNLTWNYDAKTRTLTISGTGAMYEFDTYSSTLPPAPPWYDYCGAIKKVVVEKGATTIGGHAFEDCTVLTTATLADSVTSIGDGAFDNCTALTTVSMPDTLTSIGHEAFQDCRALTGVDLPEDLTFLGAYAFYGCDALTGIVIPEGVTSILDATFQCCDILASVTLSSGLTDIGNNAFSNCWALTEITIPSGVTAIKGDAFVFCSALKKISFTGNAPTIASDAFIGVTADALYPLGDTTWTYSVRQNYGGDLNWISAPGLAISGQCGDNATWEYDAETRTLTISGTGAMYDYPSDIDVPYARSDIDTVVVGEGITRLGNMAFIRFGMKTVQLPESLKEIGYRAFDDCRGLTEVDLPDGLTTIEGEAFANCLNLTGIEIPAGVTRIDAAAFLNCIALTEVVIPEGVTSIGEAAFMMCSDLKEVTIPQSVTTIGYRAFLGCDSLTDVYYGSTDTAWKAISIGADNEALTGAAIHYTYPTGGPCGENLTWAFDAESGTLTITGTGAMYSYEEEDRPWDPYQDSITAISFPDGITTIGYAAFYDHDALTSVTIPDSVTSIKDSAFASCGKLETVDLGDGCSLSENAFLYCPIKDLELGASGSFGAQVFTSDALTSLTITADSPSFAETAFFNCSGLTEVHFKGSAPTLVTDKGWVAASFPNRVTWYYDCSQSGWLTSDRYDAENKTWAGYPLVSENHACEATVTPPTCAERGYTTYACPCGYSYVDETSYVPATGEHSYDLDAAVDPTCTGTGLTRGSSCHACGLVHVAQQVVPALGHDTVTDEAVEATCTESGLTEGSHCDRCGEVFAAQETVPALGHNPVADEAKAPTCTESGLTSGSHCGVCGEPIVAQETIPALGHNTVTDEAKAPTCTESGLTAGSHCDVCGETLVEQETVPELGHDTVTDEAVEATCTETGLTEGSHCDRCGEVFAAQETVPALGHNPVADEAVEATCTATGLTAGSHCGVCGEVLVKQETVPKKSHTVVFGDPKAPTCEEEGHEDDGMHCGVCGTVLHAPTPIPALGHNPVADEAKAPTCGATGLTAGSHCGRCGATIVAQETVPELGHDTVADEAVEATCTATGLTAGSHCGVCGETLVEQETVPELGHDTVTDEAVEATCTETGLTAGSHCGRCGEVFTAQETVPALGHSYGKDGLCIRCGVQSSDPTGTCGTVTWVLRDDVLILTPTDGEEGTMTGYASAAKYPWSDYADDITEIEVGEGVLNVSAFAFADMSRLESVFLSETVEKIGEGAFADSGRGLEITICNPDCQISDGDDGETLSGDAWIFGYTDSTAEEFAEEYGYDFCGESNRNSTPGHDTVTTLEEANCVEGQHELTICNNGCGYEKKGRYRTDPSGIHVFDDENLCTVCGFHGTQSEDGTVTPILSGQCGDTLYWALSDDKTTLTLTGTGAMWSYEKATYLAAEDDEVDEQDGSTAPWNYYAGEIGTLVLPEGMTTVGSYGFAWLSNLETLTLPGTLTGIGIASFRGCSSLTGTLVIPDKVIRIGQSAFQGCRSFTGLELGEGLETIFDSAFSDFGPRKEEPIENLTIPANVEHINADAFADAAFGGTLTILGPVEELAEGAFNGCHFDEVVLAEGVAVLREQALSFGDVEGEDLTALTIHLPLSLERIDRWAIDGYESGEALTLKYAGCEGRWDALVDSGDIDDRMTARDVNVVTADHRFTDYAPDANGITETASCDFGCGETDTRDITVAPDPIDGVQATYDAEHHEIILQNVPEGATVVVAAYENGRMVYADLVADVPANLAISLLKEMQDAKLRIFFLDDFSNPLGKFIPLSI